jgi:hypothetical protein
MPEEDSWTCRGFMFTIWFGYNNSAWTMMSNMITHTTQQSSVEKEGGRGKLTPGNRYLIRAYRTF